MKIQAEDLKNNIIKKINEPLNVGDTVKFGVYFWLVADVRKEKVLLISKYNICNRKYNEKLENVTWQTCTLRYWLNNEFYKSFNQQDREKLLLTKVHNDDNQFCGTNGGSNTEDWFFLFDCKEIFSYFENGTYQIDQEKKEKYEKYWLRFPGVINSHAAYVDEGVAFGIYGEVVNEYGVRPAFWLQI